MNTQTISQINQFLPSFLCSVSLIFHKLFCKSSLPLFVQQVCSTSTFSVILPCLSFCSAAALLFISLYTFSQFHAMPLLLFFFLLFIHFHFRTANCIQSVSFSFILTLMAVPLHISLGKRKTTVQATETPTDR